MKIDFISSPFDIKSIILLNKLKLKKIKIPSGEINNLLIEKIGENLIKKLFYQQVCLI